MLFPTIEFALFFLLVFMISWQIKANNGRKWFFVLVSYYFYGYWDYRYLVLLLQCSLTNYAAGRLTSYFSDKKSELGEPRAHRYRKLTLAFAVGSNLVILGFFKYFGFFTSSANELLTAMGLAREIPIMNILLPVGVSFFTFQGISYVVDVYRGHISGNRPAVDVLLYISFFPQLVAGPIVRADEFLPQLDRAPDKQKIEVTWPLLLIMIGLFKKSIIAHYLSEEIVAPAFADPLQYGQIDLWIAVYAYAIQIYCDFSAYSDIAIGVAALLGYSFGANFNQPYRALSLQDFWRRWHISLSFWLRDYLYVALGGNRKGRLNTYRNLFLTMLLGGLWHGAAWTFILWGALHGTYLALEKALRERLGSLARGAASSAVAQLIVFHFVCFCWILFASPSFSLFTDYLSGLGRSGPAPTLTTPFALLLIGGSFCSQFWNKNWALNLSTKLQDAPLTYQAFAVGVFLVLLSAVGPQGVLPFIYFQF